MTYYWLQSEATPFVSDNFCTEFFHQNFQAGKENSILFYQQAQKPIIVSFTGGVNNVLGNRLILNQVLLKKWSKTQVIKVLVSSDRIQKISV